MKIKYLVSPFVLALLALGVSAAPAPAEEKPISRAERRVFLDDHLANVGQAGELEYTFRKSGSMEEGFEDSVVLTVRDGGKVAGRVATTAFLSGPRNISLPEVSNAEGNPVVLYFLERDVRQMERLSSGKRNFFQKRIRLALADSNEVRPVTVRLGDREIKADEVRIQPYLNDQVIKARFAKFENKSYYFILSDQVPGGVYQLRTTVAAADAKAGAGTPLMEEVLTFSKAGK